MKLMIFDPIILYHPCQSDTIANVISLGRRSLGRWPKATYNSSNEARNIARDIHRKVFLGLATQKGNC